MANICCTNITFYSKNKQQLGAFHDKIEAMHHLGDGENWYYAKSFLDSCTSVHCIGHVDHIDDDIDERHEGVYDFEIISQDKWDPCIEMWKLILEKHYPEVKMVACAEEPGYAVYINTDKDGLYYFDRYFIDILGGGLDSSGTFETKDEVLDFLEEILGTRFKFDDINQLEDDVDRLVEFLNKHNGVGVYNDDAVKVIIHKYKEE